MVPLSIVSWIDPQVMRCNDCMKDPGRNQEAGRIQVDHTQAHTKAQVQEHHHREKVHRTYSVGRTSQVVVDRSTDKEHPWASWDNHHRTWDSHRMKVLQRSYQADHRTVNDRLRERWYKEKFND